MREFMNLKVYPYKKMTVYNAAFNSLSDMQMYILSKPKVNDKIFLKQHSIIRRPDFPGDTFDNAVDYLIGGYTGNYDLTLKMQRELEKTVPVKNYRRRQVKAMAGSHPNVPAYVAGVPKTMYRLTRAREKKFVTIWFSLAYSAKTSEQAVTNRGALTLSLIKLLEENDIGVDLKVFSSCYSKDEVFNSEIRLKSPSEPINMKKCFYPMCSVLFLRRIVLRVMESMSFHEESWYPYYGQTLSEDQFRAIFNIPETDIVISSPLNMGIYGYDINDDSKHFFEKIDLDKYIKLAKVNKSC